MAKDATDVSGVVDIVSWMAANHWMVVIASPAASLPRTSLAKERVLGPGA
ncbi:MAG: hypothetical protein NTV35_08825 [Chloroflexi bacterium]|nr:hypothetical protein [Chloroflexota bacterium]